MKEQKLIETDFSLGFTRVGGEGVLEGGKRVLIYGDGNTSFKKRYISETSTVLEILLRVDNTLSHHFTLIFVVYRWGN